MNKINKRVLSVLLCLTMLCALFIPLSVNAENDEATAKNNLIAAWTALAADTKVEKVVLAIPKASMNDADGNPITRTEVTDTTTVAGLSDASVLGPYYYDKVKFTLGDSTSSRGWSYVVGLQTIDSSLKLKDFDSVYFYAAAFNGANHCYVSLNVQIDNGNTLNVHPGTDSRAWKKITLSPTSDRIGAGFKFLVNNGSTLTHMSFGSVIGEKNVNGPALPANHAEMSLFELITAADEIDYEGFSTSADFENALNAAKSLFSEQDVAFNELVSAWKKLSADTKLVKEVLATPTASMNDADGNPRTRTEVTSSTVVDGLTDTSVLGTYYVDKLKFSRGDSNTPLAWSYVVSFSMVKNNYNPSDYSSIYFYALGYDGDSKSNVGLTVQYNSSGNLTGYPWTQNSDWTKVKITITGTNAVTGFKFLVLNTSNPRSYITHMSFGSLIGEKNVNGPALPANYAEMSLIELINAAKSADTTGFASSNEFNTAIENAIASIDPEEYVRAELVGAWDAISKEEKIAKETLAVPNVETNDADGNPHSRIEVSDSTIVSGVDDTSLLGAYYLDKIKFAKGDTATSLGWNYVFNFKTVDSTVKLDEYDSIYFYAASFNNTDYCSVNLTIQINHGNTFEGYSFTNGASWRKIDISPLKSDAIGAGVKFLVNGGATLTHMSFGSVIGERVVNGASLPSDYESMTFTALVSAAKAIDYEGFASSDRFIAAINAAQAFADNSAELREKLDTAWKNIGIRYYEEIATPKEEYIGGNGELFTRTEITESTVIEGLTDNTLLGSNYVNKLSVSAANSSQSLGWNYLVNFVTVNRDAQLFKYDSVYFYAKAYNDNNPANITVTTQINNGNNGQSHTTVSGAGWTKVSVTPTSDSVGSGFKFVIEPNYTVTHLSFGSMIGSYVVKPDYPLGADKLSFIDFVEAAENCDMTGFDATEFNAALDECKALIESRRQAVEDALTSASQTLPENVDDLSVSELIAAAKAYVIDDAAKRNELGRAVWMLNLLTDEGPVIDALATLWKNISTLPENHRLLTAQEWLVAAENLDISSVEDNKKANFESLIEELKDLLSKGKSDIAELSDLVNKANTMNYYDFTSASWTDFEKALTDATTVITNYANVTQKTVDAASESLLAAWGNLKMYVRTQFFDFMEYFLQTDPQMSLSMGGTAVDSSVIAEKVSVPNGANAAAVVANQPTGWNYVVNGGGVDLINISKSELIEVWFKANKDTNTMSHLSVQLMTAGGNKYYTAEVSLPVTLRDGEWNRIEIPITSFMSNDYKSNLSLDESFVPSRIRLVSTVGVGNYSIANFAVVTTEAVEAGVVPNVPKMKINERKEVVYEPPKNPFTGIDRGDPWGWEEKKKNPLKDKVTEEEIEDTNTNSSDENAEPVIVVEGECGDSVTWKFYSDGKLVIEGTGKMSDFPEIAPWIEENCDVLSVSLSDGITSIGDSAFHGICKENCGSNE